jgi:hypothetical protein
VRAAQLCLSELTSVIDTSRQLVAVLCGMLIAKHDHEKCHQNFVPHEVLNETSG